MRPDQLPVPKQKTVVRKADGDWQYFSSAKLWKFLHHVGLPDNEVEQVISQLVNLLGKQVHTREITASVVALLKDLPHGQRYIAIYTLKDALRRMGPDGHNFEKYIGKLFEHRGNTVKVGQIVMGECVSHEVDVIAHKQNELHLVECKFHNTEGQRSDVVVAMYTYARFSDIQSSKEYNRHMVNAWLATNTKFTNEALKFIKCKEMNVLNVENPHNDSIMDRVKKDNLFPISSISSLEAYIPGLMQAGYILLSDILRLDLELGLQIGIPGTVLTSAQNQARAILEM